MKRILLGIAVLGLFGGRALAQDAQDPTGPQPKLPTEPLTIMADNGQAYKFTVEVAATGEQQDTGLMFRPAVPPGTGMLFPQDQPEVANFWMKNTLVPLDMVFIGADGTVKTIAEDTVPYSLRSISSNVPVLATLELAAGTTAADDINVGDKVVARQFAGD